MMSNNKIFTIGSKPEHLYGYDLDSPRYEAMRLFFRKTMLGYLENGSLEALNGGMIGSDLVFAEVSANLRDEGYPVFCHMAVPCRDHEKNWDAESRERYVKILLRMDAVTRVGKICGREAIFRRDIWMLDKSGGCVAVWTGRKNHIGFIVDLARKRGLKVNVFNPFPPRLTINGKIK